MTETSPAPTAPRAPSHRPPVNGEGGLVASTDHGKKYTVDGPIIVPPAILPVPMPIPGTKVPYGLREGGRTFDADGSGGWFEGAGFLHNVRELERQFQNEGFDDPAGWLHVGVATVGVAGAAADPAGALLSGLAGWVIDHVEPLPTYLDWLAGDPDGVVAHANTWENIGNETRLLASDLQLHLNNDTKGMKAESVYAYQGATNDRVKAVHALGNVADMVSKLVKAAAAVVDTVRCIVRDLCAEAFAEVAKFVLRRLGLPDFSGVHTIVARYVPKVKGWIQRLFKAVHAIGKFMSGIPVVLKPAMVAMNNMLPNMPTIAAGEPVPIAT